MTDEFRPNALSYTKIQHFDRSTAGEKYIRRLDVAMNDSSRVRSLKCVADLCGDAKCLHEFQGPASDALFESFAFEKFNGDEKSCCRFVNFVNRADVGMIKGGGRLGFAFEALQGLLITSERRGQKLKRDVTAKLQVLCFVNHSHAALPKSFKHAVVGYRFAFQPRRAGLILVNSDSFGENCNGGFIQKAVRGSAVLQQRFDFLNQAMIPATSLFQKRIPLLIRHLHRRMVKLLDPLPAFRFHADLPG